MRKKLLLPVIGLLALAILIAGCTQPETDDETAEVGILYTSAPSMPQLLSTNQVDGFLIWQPNVEIAQQAGIGKVIAYSNEMPPDNIWENHTCCALVAREDLIQENPDLVNAVAALTIVSVDYIDQNQDRAIELTAEWLFGDKDIQIGDVTLDPVEIERGSIPTFRFTAVPTQEWIDSNHRFVQTYIDLGLLKGQLKDASPEEIDEILFDFDPYYAAEAMLEKGEITTPAPYDGQLGIGYLPSDHDAPMFIAAKEWQYFNDQYGIALKPKDETKLKPDLFDLIVNGEVIANVMAVEGQGGAGLMTAMGQNAIQFAYAGTPPTIIAIDGGNEVKIINPIHTEGSGLIAAMDAPADDWPSFVQWAKDRSASGKPLIIATVQGSIQDVILRYALQDAGLSVKLIQT